MSGVPESASGLDNLGDVREGLRGALLRLTSPHYDALREEIVQLQEQLSQTESLRKEMQVLESGINELDEKLAIRAASLDGSIEALQTELADKHGALQDALEAELGNLRQLLGELKHDLPDPAQVSERVSPVLVPMIHTQARQQEVEFAEAVAPVIGPAIRHQIREAKDDIIDALYPLIGQIIGKAISEAIRELTRNIDARLRQGLNFRSRLGGFLARMRGVSQSELILREALPFSIERVFLIHQKTGLLLVHQVVSGDSQDDMGTVSGMLTAIQDFVRDSFGRGEGELEEITHGDRRILLESGQFASIAVVLTGVEPSGYSNLMRKVVWDINVQFENDLRKFQGVMEQLPNFEPSLMPLVSPDEASLQREEGLGEMSRGQKWMVFGGLAFVLILIALAVFACIFTLRLWPLVFPGSSASVLPEVPPTETLQALIPTLTASLAATVPPTGTSTQSASPSPIPAATGTPEPSPTATPSQAPSMTPSPLIGVLTGNLNVRAGPAADQNLVGSLLKGERVRILERRGDWLFVRWPVEGLPEIEGWVATAWVTPEGE